MRQRQPHQIGCKSVLPSVLAFALALVILAPRPGHAQGQCGAEFQQSSVPILAGGSACQTAVAGKCLFQLALCVNQSGTACTPQDLKTKKIKAKGHCGPVAKVNVKANGTSAVCGTAAGITVRTKKHNKKAGTCKISAKAGKAAATKLTLTCQPTAGLCPPGTGGTTTTTTTLPIAAC